MDDDTARFEAVYRSTYPSLRRYAAHRGLTGADADELLADVYAIAWRRRDQLPEERALPWLFAVAANVRRNRGRGERRRQALLRRLPRPEASPPPAEPTDRHVAAALATLDAADRDILLLVAWDGLSPHDLAVALQCPPGTARVRLHRARRRFRAALAARSDDADVDVGRTPAPHRPPTTTHPHPTGVTS